MNRVKYISFFTPFYSNVAKMLRGDLEKQNLDFEITPIKDRGWWKKNVRYKPRFLLESLERWKDYAAIVWIDADARVDREPVLFQKTKADIGVYYETAKRTGFEEPLGGTIFLRNSQKVKLFVAAWADKVEATDIETRRPEQQVLRSLLAGSSGLKIERLPDEYSVLPPYTHCEEPVIRHYRMTTLAKELGLGELPMSPEEVGRHAAHVSTMKIRRERARRNMGRLQKQKSRYGRKTWPNDLVSTSVTKKGKKCRGKPMFTLAPRIAHGNKGALSFTFDDGRLDHAEILAPLLEKYGFRGSFYVIPGAMGPCPCLWERPGGAQVEIAGWLEWAELARRGHEIGNHSFNHPRFSKLKGHELDRWCYKKEIIRSCHEICFQTNQSAITWAWPYHEREPKAERMIEQHHLGIRPLKNRLSYNRSAEGGSISLTEANRWVDHLIRKHLWGVAVIHDVGYGYKPLDTGMFEEHLKHVASKKGLLGVEPVAALFRRRLER